MDSKAGEETNSWEKMGGGAKELTSFGHIILMDTEVTQGDTGSRTGERETGGPGRICALPLEN